MTTLYQFLPDGRVLRALCKTESYAYHIAGLDPEIPFTTITCVGDDAPTQGGTMHRTTELHETVVFRTVEDLVEEFTANLFNDVALEAGYHTLWNDLDWIGGQIAHAQGVLRMIRG